MRIFFFLILLFYYSFSFSQVEIKGFVGNIKGVSIYNATIQLVEIETDITKDYTTSKKDGSFFFTLPKSHTNYFLRVTLLGYTPQKVVLNKINISNFRVYLIEEDFTLDEIVIITNFKEFQSKKDTIKYNVSRIRDSTETSLKDLIEKLPGLTIDENKKVNFNGNVIDKVIIEGEDFFGKKHEMSTENLPAEAIQGIQILKNFKEFDDIGNEKTGKIVLNITLNKNYKNKLVGNIEGNSGIEEKNQLHTNIFKFLNKGNFALITEANNIGESAINMLDYIEMQGGIGNFTANYSEGGSGVYELDHAKIPRYVFVNQNVDARNTVFNSLNFSNKFSEKFKVNGYLTLDHTKIEELTNSIKSFVNTSTSTLQENESSAASSYLGNSFMNFVYKPSDKQVFKFNLKINSLKNKEIFNITGGLKLDYIIRDNDFLLGQSLVYKNQLSPKLLFQSLISNDYKTQDRVFNLSSDAPVLNLNFSNDFILKQTSNVLQNTININSKLLYDFSENIKLISSFSFIKNNEKLNNKGENQNEFFFEVVKKQHNFSYLNSLNFRPSQLFSINGSLNYVRNLLEVNENLKKYNWFLPSFSIRYELSEDKNLSISYSKSIKNISIFEMNTNSRVLNYQTKINKNDDVFTPTEKESVSFGFNSLNSLKNSMLSINTNFFKTKNEIGYNSIIKNNFIEQNYIRVPLQGFDISLNHSKTLKNLPLKWNSKIFYKNSRSFSFLVAEKNRNINYNYGVDLRFNSIFKNSPFQAKFDFYYSQINTKNDFSVLDFTLKRVNVYPKIYGKVKNFTWDVGCLFQNVTSSNTSQNIYSLNFATQWNFNPEIQLFFKGTNILNLKSNQFISQQNTEVFSQFTTFERLEGNILLGMRYNF